MSRSASTPALIVPTTTTTTTTTTTSLSLSLPSVNVQAGTIYHRTWYRRRNFQRLSVTIETLLFSRRYQVVVVVSSDCSVVAALQEQLSASYIYRTLFTANSVISISPNLLSVLAVLWLYVNLGLCVILWFAYRPTTLWCESADKLDNYSCTLSSWEIELNLCYLIAYCVWTKVRVTTNIFSENLCNIIMLL